MEKQLPCTEKYITEMVRKHSDMVLRLALAYVRNMADAQDICQDVFIRLFQHHPEFADQDHERAWMIRVTINRCKDMLRSPWKRYISALERPELPIPEAEEREVVSAVLKLPVKYRIVIHLYYFENYSTAEIAAMLQYKEGTVRTQLKRARERLKAVMGGMEDE
ncbi:sigma-70 family RNA polymerase sigma factor [Paenibacillus sp. FSL L8-0340]|uniref:sigma-70 family RNA polymerase sigma factor n=1 Tax=Paenibacillus sp. FSL L8-0340 TaxID=2954685 RepID=UPI0031586F82